MDGTRFDRLTRSWAQTRSRRGVLGALVGLAASLVGVEAAGAACVSYARRCTTGQTCCGGAACQDGVCRCPSGTSVCTAAGGTACYAPCPPGQVLGAGCRCLCRATGRVPGPDGCGCASLPEGSPCGDGKVCLDGTCQGNGVCRNDVSCTDSGTDCGDETCTPFATFCACTTEGGRVCVGGNFCEDLRDCTTTADCPPASVCNPEACGPGTGNKCQSICYGVAPR